MSANRTLNTHAHRIRRRRRLTTSHPNFAARHPKLENHLAANAARFNALDGALSGVLVADGADYAVGDEGTIDGGTFSLQARYRVLSVSTGAVVTFQMLEAGSYTVNPGVAAATTATSGIGTGLTITTTLGTNPAGITAQEILDSLTQAAPDVRARHHRETTNAAQVAAQGIPLA